MAKLGSSSVGTGSVWIFTPKALANFSPAVRAQREPWDSNKQSLETLKGFAN